MALDPVVIQMKMPDAPGPINKLPRWRWVQALMSTKSTKIITAVSAIAISITMVSIAVFTLLANNASFQNKHNLDTLPKAQTSGSQKSFLAMPGGGIANGVGGTTGTNSPVVTITADPASVNLGGTSQLKWSVTNNPSSCVASDDWSGAKAATGSEATPALTKSQTYLFTLTCDTATGTGFATVSVGTVTQSGGTGSVATRPAVSFAANPTAIYAGDSSTLTWSVTNSPTSCTASGDWSGTKSSAGPQSTGTLTTARQYNYTLQCSNSAGTSPSVTVTVLVTNPPAGLPVVAIFASPGGPLTPGSSTVLTWSTTNSPTSCTASGAWSGAKATSGTDNTGALNSIQSYTFTLTCTTGTATGFNSTSVQVLPNTPAVSLTVSPTSILVGQSATLTWKVTNTTAATTCTASGSWPGNLNVTPVSGGSLNTGTLSTAKTYTYSLSCTNQGGTGYQDNVPLTVSSPSPPVVSISVSPISIKSGQSATITWSATNNPTSCTPSNDLTGTISPLTGGSESTGTLTSVRTYTYTLKCSNAGGASNTAQTTLSVVSGAAAVSKPVVTISVSPTTISTGGAATVSWSATNSPTSCSAGGSSSNWVSSPGASGSTSTGPISTAGTRTYSITCTNSAGSATGTTSPGLTIDALPTVSVSLGSGTINTGSSTTYSWSSKNATSCSGGGSLSGSMATSGGPITTGTKNTSGTYNYTVTCVNSIGGSASATATLTVNSAPVYCNGATPCYDNAQLVANGWGYIGTKVIDLESFAPNHSNGPDDIYGSYGMDVLSILNGASNNNGESHSHGSVNSDENLMLNSYLVQGTYDPSKP